LLGELLLSGILKPTPRLVLGFQKLVQDEVEIVVRQEIVDDDVREWFRLPILRSITIGEGLKSPWIEIRRPNCRVVRVCPCRCNFGSPSLRSRPLNRARCCPSITVLHTEIGSAVLECGSSHIRTTSGGAEPTSACRTCWRTSTRPSTLPYLASRARSRNG
jgi:hypothetical protein